MSQVSKENEGVIVSDEIEHLRRYDGDYVILHFPVKR